MPSDPQQVQAIFADAVQKSESERDEFLQHQCGGDSELRRRVEALIAAHEQSGSFLDSPPKDLAGTSPTIAQSLPEQAGSLIGPFKLLQQIGEGGMGSVYMAEQIEPVERRVALKIIKPGMDTKSVIARFEAERQALAMMDHPNIAKVLDVGTTNSGRPYFVMELVRGVPITQYCDEHQLTPRERLELFLPVCHAVQHAHQKGIIHRDIKPSNVLVAEYDDKPVPKIIDFGLAKAMEKRLTAKTMFTEFGQIVGTPDYMSPEQAKLNQMDIDTRSDIYSLGVLLYELLSGNTPFDRQRLRSAAFDELLRIIREEEPPKPSQRLSTVETLPSIAANRHITPADLTKQLSGELDWIVMKSIEKDRSRRYETANGLASDLRRYLNDDPVLACPPSSAYLFKKFARRNKAIMSTVAVVAFALLLGIAGTGWQAFRATKAERLATGEALRADREATRANREADRARQEAALAVAERNRSDENLDLAFAAIDEVYLRSVGQSRLLSQSHGGGATQQPLSDAEKELLQLAMDFYGQLANQNLSGDRATLRTAAALNRLGEIQNQLKDRTSARQSFQQALERLRDLGPTSDSQTWYWSELGQAHLGLGQLAPWIPDAPEVFEEAIEAFSKALQLNPNHVPSLEGRYIAYKAIRDDRKSIDDAVRLAELQPEARRHLQLFWQYALAQDSRVRDSSKALEHAEKAVELAPKNAEAWALLGRASWAAQHDRERSERELKRALELDPNSYVVRVQRTLMFKKWNQPERALPEIEVAVSLRPTDFYALRHRGGTLRKLGRYDEALVDYAAAEKDNPNDYWLYYSRSEIYKIRGETQKYETELTKALEQQPQRWHVYKRRAVARFELGRFDEALDDLRASLKHNPDDTGALVWIPLADVAECPDEEFRAGLLELASSAEETENNKLELAQNRVRLFVALGKTEQALQEAERALQQDPDNAGLWTEIALLHVEQADLSEACDNLRKALEIDPNWLTHYRLALCQATANDLPGYRDSCRAMVERFNNSEKPIELNFTAWTAVLAADALEDFAPAILAAESAMQANPDDEQYLKTLGAVLFRAGHADRAIEELSKLDDPDDEQTKASPAYGWYFLAMAHHTSGNRKQAEDYLARANEHANAELSDQDKRPLWNRRLTLELLKREATQLISASTPAEKEQSVGDDPSKAK